MTDFFVINGTPERDDGINKLVIKHAQSLGSVYEAEEYVIEF